MKRRLRSRRERGSSLVEFALVALLLVMLLIGVVEMCRLALIYDDVTQAARAGVRYAIVHGSDNPASTSAIQTIVDNFFSSAPAGTPTVAVSYPTPTGFAGCGSTSMIPGCPVQVTVTYTYDPLESYFPLGGINLSSTSEGVITF